MPVTEFALIKLRGGHDDLDFLEALMQCQELQDGWMRHHQPHCIDRGTNLSTMYIQHTADAPFLLITAPWDSPDAHGEWLQSRENQSGFAKLSEYIAPGCDSVLLFHMDPAGERQQLRGQFAPEESFSVYRLSAEPGRRDALQRKYQDLERDVRKLGADAAWAGWRIEKSRDTEDLVVFARSGVPEERIRELASLADQTDHRRFEHVV